MSRAASVLARASHLRGAPSINRLRYEAGGRSAIVAQAGAALLLSVLGGAVIAKTGDWQVAAALLGGATFVALGMLQPAVFLTALLVVRPLLDGLPGDPGQLLGLALIGVCALVVTSAPQLVRPTATWAFSILLIVSALACLPAFMEFPGLIGLDPIEELVRLAALFAMYFLAAQLITTPPVMRRIIVIVGLSGVGPALWALGELARSPTVIAQLGLVRVSGSFVNPVALSSYLALCILILLSLPRGDVSRWVRWPAVGVMTAALVVSYGREGWAFLLVGIILLHWRTNKRLIAGVAIASTALVLLAPGVRARVLPTEQATGSQVASTFASYDWRLANWRGLLIEYGKRPLTGWGLETTVIVNPRRPTRGKGDPKGGFQAHSAAVRALVEGGILLLAAVVALFVVLIGSLLRIARDPELAPYARVLAAAWMAMVVVAVSTNDLLDGTALMYALLAMTGGLEGAYRVTAAQRARAGRQRHSA